MYAKGGFRSSAGPSQSENSGMSGLTDLARAAIALALPTGVLDRGPSLRGTRFLAGAAFKAHLTDSRPFQMVNVGACDGALYDDVTPWLHRIPKARAVLVEPIPYNQKRLRANYPDEKRFLIEPVAIAQKRGTVAIKTFDEAALVSGQLPLEFVGCSSFADTNLMSGKTAWGETDPNFGKFAPHLREIDVPAETLQTVLDRNDIGYIDAFVIDCEGADWLVFEQLDLKRYRPTMIKVEIGALSAPDAGRVLLKLKLADYQVGIHAEDIWAFA
jgi:FkbM family methyltransferase